MNTNLAKFWDDARMSSCRWAHDDVQSILAEVARSNPGATVDWDDDAGEGWGRVIQGDQVIALVATDSPIVILKSSAKWDQAFLDGAGAHVLVIDDMSKRCFSLDAADFLVYFGRTPSDAIDWGSFSIDELWWATV